MERQQAAQSHTATQPIQTAKPAAVEVKSETPQRELVGAGK